MIFLLLLITQIIIESLPISSSGHVKLIENIGLKLYPQSNYDVIAKSMEYFFHGPTILILIIFFFKDIFYLFSNFSKNIDFLYYWLTLVFIADLITLIFYFLFQYFQIKSVLFFLDDKFKFFPGNIFGSSLSSFSSNFSQVPFSYFSGFLITIALLFSLKFINNNNLITLNFKHAIILGIVQGISLLPGISRLAATIVAACWLGATMQTAFYFSCAIQFPLICAGFLKGCYFVYKNQAILMNFVKPAWLFSLTTIISSFISLLALYSTYIIFLSGYGYYFGLYMLIPTILAFILGI